MDYEIPTSTTEHIYDGLEMLAYDTENSRSSHTSQEHVRPDATLKVQDRWRIVIYIVVVVITAGAAGVTGYYSGHMLMTTEQFSWSSWSHWTICSREHMNRTRVIPVCHDNMCNYREDHETRQCKETEQFSWSSWSHWTSCDSQRQNRTRTIPVCKDNLCNYREDYETRKCEEKEQFSWSSWSHWTSCASQRQNRTRVIPVCEDNLCNYIEEFETPKCEEKGYEIDLNVRLNRSSLYKNWYISNDNLMISNVQTPDTAHRSRGIGFKKYMGAMADRCVEPEDVMTFGVQYDFHITTTLTELNLVFEVGVAEIDKIDRTHYVGSPEVGGYSFYVHRLNNYTRLVTQITTNYDVIIPELSNITKGTTKNGRLLFLIDRLSDTFSILKNHQVLYTFTNVPSTVPLCPVFGVYNADRLQTKLRLMHTTYMKFSK